MAIMPVRRTSVRLPKWHGVDRGKGPPNKSAPYPEALVNQQETGMETDPHLGSALEVVRQRSVPGMFIVGPDDRLLYANEQTLSIFKDATNIPLEVHEFCRQIRNSASNSSSGMDCAILRGPGEDLYAYRGCLVAGQDDFPSHVMVLVEKVVERDPINLKRAKAQFGLSDREIEVVTLLAKGLSNKEISAKLYVSEYTVKTHLKNITRKVGADSRGSILAILK